MSCSQQEIWKIIRHSGYLGLVALLVLVGCSSYPPIQSREGRQLIKRLYVACNAKDSQKLTAVEEELSKLTDLGTISSAERKAFDSIVALARDGKWEDAEKASLRLAEGQVGYDVTTDKSPPN